MKISELVQHLEDLQDEHGDLDCVLIDADTQWSWCMRPENIQFSKGEKGTGAAIEFFERYGDAVDYLWPETVVPEPVVRDCNPLSMVINKQAMGILKNMFQHNYLDHQAAFAAASSYAPGATISIKRPIRYNQKNAEQSPSQTRIHCEDSLDNLILHGDLSVPPAPRNTIKATKD